MNLMLDFETFGTDPRSIVLTLGAVAFNKTGIVGEQLFEFDMADQVKQNRNFSADTLLWWFKQSQEARDALQPTDFKLSCANFLKQFGEFVDTNLKEVNEDRSELKPWGNGANFDIPIIEDIYKNTTDFKAEIPWKFWNVWCFRTFNNIFNCKNMVARPHGTHHNALEDARYQTNCVLAVYKAQDLKKRKTT